VYKFKELKEIKKELPEDSSFVNYEFKLEFIV